MRVLLNLPVHIGDDELIISRAFETFFRDVDEVRYQSKSPDFLVKNPDIRNPDFLLKNG